MSRLIDVDDAIERLGAYLMADAQIEWGGTASDDIEDWKELASDILKGAPTIEPKHGEWRFDEKGNFFCSECGRKPNDQIRTTDYCPNCGAEMK